MGSWRFPGLTLKLLVALVGTMVLISAGQGFLCSFRHQKDLEDVVSKAADRNVDVVRRSARSAMLRNNREQLHEIMDTIATEPGIVRLRIFNRDGMIMYSTRREEVGRVVDKQAEACVVCHKPGAPAGVHKSKDRIRIFKEKDGTRTLGVILPIANEEACARVGCHASLADVTVLGVLDVNMTLKDVDRSMQRAAVRRLYAILVTILLVTMVVMVFILVFVNRPLQSLMVGTQRVAEGDLDYSIPVMTRDEMGALAMAFNAMTRRLKESMRVIQHWNETLQKRVEQKTEELGQAHRHILKVERMATLGRLAAIIAHEINNPLAGIRTYAKLLKKKASRENYQLTDEDIKYLGLMESEAARCGDIVRGLLDFSRKAPLRLEKQELGHLVEEALRLVQHKLDLQSVEVKKDLAPDLPEISCSGQQVVQAIIAILINACEAMPSEGVLEVTTGSDAGGAGVWVRIHDSGVGMDETTLEHIFEPFFTTKEEGHGVGLGLAVVYGIVQHHGGRIEAESQPRQGSTFTLHFPLQPPAALSEEMGQGHGEAG